MQESLIFIFLGSVLLFSLVMAKGVSIIKSPLVLGYIICGAILGPAIAGVIKTENIGNFDIINTVTLSLLGFGIGGELQFKELKKLGASIIWIVIFEATMTFIVVGIFTALVTKSIPLGLIYGALASATAPAGTTDVIKQYKADGVVTKTLFAVMGLDDIYSLLIYTVAIPFAIILIGGHGLTVGEAMMEAGKEVVLAVLFGIAAGWIIYWIGKITYSKTFVLAFSIGMLFAQCGVASHFHLSPILLNMVSGIVLVNKSKLVSRKINMALGEWSPPIYMIFFALIGARLNFGMIWQYLVLILVYIMARNAGKWGGAWLGGAVSGADKNVKKYLGFTLLSQAGVAIGLSLAAGKYLELNGLHEQATQVVSVMTATTFLIMLIGPVSCKFGLGKAGELHLDH
jgi:Kef-type K+ transport system membrane component KefB